MKCNIEFSTGCEEIKVTITWANSEVVDPGHINLYLAWLEEDKIKSTPSQHSLHVVQRSTTIKRSFLKIFMFIVLQLCFSGKKPTFQVSLR